MYFFSFGKVWRIACEQGAVLETGNEFMRERKKEQKDYVQDVDKARCDSFIRGLAR